MTTTNTALATSGAPSANGQAVEKRGAEPKRHTFLKDTLQNLLPSIKAVLPKHLSPERMVKVALTAAIRTPLIYDCTPQTIMQSVMVAAQLGLDCGGALGSAYLVPFKRNQKQPDGSWKTHYECTLIIGYRGMIDLARRSGQIQSICVRPVFQDDSFEIEYGLEERLVHKPGKTPPHPAKLIGAYLVARFVGGGHHLEWMTKVEIDAVRARSKAAEEGPWVTDYIEMARKTVVRRGFKYLPMSIEIMEKLAETAEVDGGAALADIIDTTATEVSPALPEGTGAGEASPAELESGEDLERAKTRTAEVLEALRKDQGSAAAPAEQTGGVAPATSSPAAAGSEETPGGGARRRGGGR